MFYWERKKKVHVHSQSSCPCLKRFMLSTGIHIWHKSILTLISQWKNLPRLSATHTSPWRLPKSYMCPGKGRSSYINVFKSPARLNRPMSSRHIYRCHLSLTTLLNPQINPESSQLTIDNHNGTWSHTPK